MASERFSKMEIDAIGEILNISLGSSATAVSTMLNARVDITTPIVNVVSKEEFKMDKVDPAVGVEINYVAGLEGENVMLLKRHDVKVIVEMLMGMEMPDEEFELNEINISAVCEVMNQMMGASSTALSEFLGRMVNISTPVSFEVKNEQEFIDKYFVDDSPKVVVIFTLKIADRLESEFFNVMPMELAKGLVKGFLPADQIIEIGPDGMPIEAIVPEAPAEPEAAAPSGRTLTQEEIEELLAGGITEESAAPQPAASSGGGMYLQGETEKPLASMQAAAPTPAPQPVQQAAAPIPASQPVQQAVSPAQPVQQAAPSAQPVMQPVAAVNPELSMMQMQMMQQMMQQMQTMQQAMQESMQEKKKAPEPKMIHVQSPAQTNLKPGGDIVLEGEQEENMELIMGVPLEISVEIGRTKKYVKDILDFTKGSLVVLDKLAGEQVDLYVNGQCIAKGDVVVVEDNFGIRITEITKINLLALE